MINNRRPPEGNVRRVQSNGQNIRGVLTNKTGRIVQFESLNERSLLLRLDRDSQVKDYCSQPEILKYIDGHAKQRNHFPDFKVWLTNGEIEIHEVTITKRRNQPDRIEREKIMIELCKARNWRYLVHTEQSLPQGGELANLLTLIHYRPSHYAHPLVSNEVYKRLTENKSINLSTIIHDIEESINLAYGEVASAIFHMLWHGKIMTDMKNLIFLDSEFSSKTKLWLPGESSL